MKVSILTIFPEIFSSFLKTSLISKAISSNKLSVETVNIRDFAEGPHQQVDDIPYGGGAGMVMKPEPLAKAIEACKAKLPNSKVVLMAASGHKFTQKKAEELSQVEELIIICARYEGLDQRVIDQYVDYEICIGDFILLGGEVPAMAVIEAVGRLIPDVISNKDSLKEESFSLEDSQGLLIEGPQYTRPAEFKGAKVPEVLVSGDHKKIAEWRHKMAVEKREKYRPDLKNN